MSQPPSSPLAPLLPLSKRRFRPWLLAVPIALTAIAAGSYWAFRSFSSSKTFTGANLFPANTLVATTLVVDRSEWQRLRQLGTSGSRAWLEQKIIKSSKEWLGDLPVADLATWIGRNIYLAQLPNNQNVVLLPIRTTAPALSGQVRQYQGVAIYEANKVARAVVATNSEKFLVVGKTPAIEQVIDTWKSGKSLAKTPGYIQAQQALPDEDAIGQVYLNLPGLLGNKPNMTSQGLLLDIAAKDQVLIGRGLLWGSRKIAHSNRSPEITKLLPNQTMMLLTGSNLAGLWQEYGALASTGAATLKQNLQANTGLNLEADVLKWGNGDFGVALVAQKQSADQASRSPSATSLIPTAGGLLLLAKSADRTATDRAMTTLDQAATKQQYRVITSSFQNSPVVHWSTPVGGVQGSHGWLADNVAFLALGAPLAEQVLSKPQGSVGDRPEFQQVMQSAINPHDGQFYLDLAQMIAAGNIAPSQFPADTQTLMTAIQAIGLTSNGLNDNTKGEFTGKQQRLDIAISLKSQPDDPKPSP